VPGEASFTTSIQFEDPNFLAETIEQLPDHDPQFHAIGIERIAQTVCLLW